MTDPISDMLTQIRNAQMVNKKSVSFGTSKIKYELSKLLESEGYISEVKIEKIEGRDNISFSLKYDQDGKGVINEINRVSSPGQRIYAGNKDLPKKSQGLGIVVISTSQGLMTDRDARKRKLGGEIICNVF